MSPAYSTINVRPHVAQLARALAKSRGIPVGALIEQLVQSQVTTTTVATPPVATIDGRISILLGNMLLNLSVEEARYFAVQLRNAAEGRSASLNLDSPQMISIGRRGVGVVVEAQVNGQPVRTTTGTHEATTVADALDGHLAENYPDQA